MVLVGSNILFAAMYFQATKELEGTKIVLTTQRYNEKTINFLKMFIQKVIKSDQEVDFETRLKLENLVRDLNDEEILAAWQKFVNSPDEISAQKNVKELLGLLVDKIYIR